MAQIGRKVYYESSTGNVILATSEMSGDVVATTEAQDFALYAALKPYQQSAVGVLQLAYGQDSANFGKYPYHIDTSTSPASLVWDTTATDLADAQTQKIAQLRDMYQQTLAAGFQVTISGTQYTFGWQDSDMTHMDALQTSIDKSFETFPAGYADVKGNPVSIPDQTTLNSIEQTATKFTDAQHKQIESLVANVESATTVSAVNAIQWTAASY